MIILDDVNTKLQLTTSTAADCDVVVDFVDVVAGTSSEMKSQETAITTATTTDILAVPGASTQRRVHCIRVKNKDTIAQTVLIVKDVSATDYQLTPTVTVAAGELMMIGLDGEISTYDASGRKKTFTTQNATTTGYASIYTKSGATSEAAGNFYCFGHVAGNPGIWALGSALPGTPGLNGRTTDGTATADFGCVPYKNATVGSNYLSDFKCAANVLGVYQLVDFLWVNSNISGTTTTNQAITSGAMPARDLDGSVNGRGCGIALYFYTAAGTNAGAISTSTVSYTNTAGTAGRTATLTATTGFQIPTTPALGTWVPFSLAAGDTGVKSIEGITLATSLGVVACAHLVVYRPLATSASSAIYNVGSTYGFEQNPGVRLYDGTCAHIVQWASATTATNVMSLTSIMER